MYEELGFTEGQQLFYFKMWKTMKARDPITMEIIKPRFEDFLKQKRAEIEQMKQRGMSEYEQEKSE